MTPFPFSIDGTLACPIPKANFYLIDPSGVTFGPDAHLDLHGSFAVTTADTIKLGANGSFNASKQQGSVLTTAAPAAFGFLSPNAAGVSIQGTAATPSRLVVPQGKVLSFVSGPIQIVHGQLVAPGGQANLIAVTSVCQVTLNATDAHAMPGVSAFTDFANVSLTQGSEVTLDGVIGGGFFVRANDMTLNGFSAVTSTTSGNFAGSAINLQTSGSIRLASGLIDDATFGSGPSGNITVVARNLTIDGPGNGIFSGSTPNGLPGGSGGEISIDANTVRILAGGLVDSSTFGTGRSGFLKINARRLNIDGSGNPFSTHTGIVFQSGIAGGVSLSNAGEAGLVAIHATDVDLGVTGRALSLARPVGTAADQVASVANEWV